jgi:hypothetical protein
VYWLVWGLALAITDMRTPSFQPALVFLFAGSAVLGFARPRAWWFWALALAAWVPAEPLVNAVFRLGLAPQSEAGAWFLPPVPALLGGLVGRLVARAARERGPARA